MLKYEVAKRIFEEMQEKAAAQTSKDVFRVSVVKWAANNVKKFSSVKYVHSK